MPQLPSIHFDLANGNINIEPTINLPIVADSLLNNQAFTNTAFTDGAILLDSTAGEFNLPDLLKLAGVLN